MSAPARGSQRGYVGSGSGCRRLLLRPLPVGEGKKACPRVMKGEGNGHLDGPVPLTHHCIVGPPSKPSPTGRGHIHERRDSVNYCPFASVGNLTPSWSR